MKKSGGRKRKERRTGIGERKRRGKRRERGKEKKQ